MILSQDFLSFIRTDWLLNNQTRNQSITKWRKLREIVITWQRVGKYYVFKRSKSNNCSDNYKLYKKQIELLVPQIVSFIDVLLISETKIDEPPTSQFLMDVFSSPYRLGRNANGGGILVYLKNNIITKSLKTRNLSNEAIFIDMNLWSKEWLICFI